MNSATGFAGFQDQMREAQEAMGGDALAAMAAEHLFTHAIRKIMRGDADYRETRDYGFPGPLRSEWLRARDSDFDDAAEIARQSWRAPAGWPYTGMSPFEWMAAMGRSELIGDIPGKEHGIHFVWSKDRAWRLAPLTHGRIGLAYRTRAHVAMTEPGLRLAEANGHRVKSRYRQFGSEAAATAFLGRACRDLWDGPR